MRVLILGGNGMLGRRLTETLGERHDVRATVREAGGSASNRFVGGVDACDFARVAEVVGRFRPEAVLNAIGLVKQRPEGQDPLPALEVNAVFPHRLARLCAAEGIRLVHFSTDCVFSGARGSYRESDVPDAADIYGRTKQLGEVGAPHLTLRTSIIGLEPCRQQGLVEWFLARRGPTTGYRRAIFSGLTTTEVGRLVDRLLVGHRDLTGLWHVASAPIDKFTLLEGLARELGREDVRLEPVDEPACDRSLDGSAFVEATGYRPPTWGEMLRELAQEIRERRSRGCFSKASGS